MSICRGPENGGGGGFLGIESPSLSMLLIPPSVCCDCLPCEEEEEDSGVAGVSPKGEENGH